MLRLRLRLSRWLLWLCSLALLGLSFAPLPGAAQPGARGDEFELADVLEIVVLEHEVLAIDARGGGATRAALDLGENVLWSGARGRVGVVVTDRRLLAVSTISSAWQETRWRRRESPAHDIHLGGRVAATATNERVLGFDGRSGNLVESDLGPRESATQVDAGENVAVVLTDRRALGVSAFAGGFFDVRLRLGEDVEDLSALANLATLRTSRRILVFRAQGGSWEERGRDLR